MSTLRFIINKHSTYVVISISLLFTLLTANNLRLIQVENEQSKKREVLSAWKVQEKNTRFPTRLIIPAIKINANVQELGLTVDGDMDVPSNTMDVGWFSLGPPPGEIGSAVIAGHFDGENGSLGVFANLDKLKTGDLIYVEDNLKITTTFVVSESRLYNPGIEFEVFGPNEAPHLNLITCFGVWDKTKKSYNKRLVVFADNY